MIFVSILLASCESDRRLVTITPTTQSFFTTPEFHADPGLFPAPVDGTFTPTPTFIIMCAPPACTDGALTCGNPDGCPGGCGIICATLTPTP
jgi:hypothetical protein